jgi:hypothetical protein
MEIVICFRALFKVEDLQNVLAGSYINAHDARVWTETRTGENDMLKLGRK